MGRILGIDYGTKRIGLAVTDPLGIFASPLATIHPSGFESFIEDYMKSEMIDEFVIGYPVRMNNDPSEVVKHIDPFIRKLKKRYPGRKVHLVDERFTSQMALRAMIDGGLKKKDRQNRQMVDRISASIILQSFLDKKTFNNKKEE
ncbi:MAG TPA: Holliday junction resolvase RuvX [Bacteroidales bacterium]|nr:Holliday junction resolvase RuvX [Bacteroidales bacterium]